MREGHPNARVAGFIHVTTGIHVERLFDTLEDLRQIAKVHAVRDQSLGLSEPQGITRSDMQKRGL